MLLCFPLRDYNSQPNTFSLSVSIVNEGYEWDCRSSVVKVATGVTTLADSLSLPFTQQYIRHLFTEISYGLRFVALDK